MKHRRNMVVSGGLVALCGAVLFLAACGHSPRQEYYLIRGIVIEPTAGEPSEMDVILPENRHATAESRLDDL